MYTEITPEILATISHLKMEKVLPLIDFSTSQEIAESWYLDKSEDESEEGPPMADPTSHRNYIHLCVICHHYS
jgi:hypothetical protein